MYGMFFSLIELSTLHPSTIDQVDFQVWSRGYKTTHTLTVTNHFCLLEKTLLSPSLLSEHTVGSCSCH